MELIDQRTKGIMEECKRRAKAAGLEVNGETLEYIITNREELELSVKVNIPTLYDYWVDNVEVVKNKWIYDAFPHNPYETVVNTRPPISFYNDNNPDWLNVMIFYHVLGHIDFFQNNVFFRKTWDDDFCGQALADKRLLNKIREELGEDKRQVDYVIEFARAIDNLVGYYQELEEAEEIQAQNIFGTFSEKSNFYFGEFLRRLYDQKLIELKFYYDEVERYNRCIKQFSEKLGEITFFDDHIFKSKLPEFNSAFKKYKEKKESKTKANDILKYLMENSEFINRDKNKWMKDVLGVVRRTSLYFQPQFRDRICNEGWASFWHHRLFITDERIKGHEVDFALVNSKVLVDLRLGFNPYIVGMHLFEFIEELARKGKLSYGFQLIKDIEARRHYDQKLKEDFGKKVLFETRKNINDFILINFLSDEDFQDFVDKYKLFVAGTRINPQKPGFVDVYIKSRNGKEYRDFLNKSLYHPPYIVINPEKKTKEGELYLDHVYEGRTLVTKYIPSVLSGLSYFCGGGVVKLETTEFEMEKINYWERLQNPDQETEYEKVRVLYTCEGKNMSRNTLRREKRNG
ncbi:MAG: SpoVR family protein [Candidatus Nealsonbacteria bacterium]|nr:SpoVR family protein [Candidatus Nealsonbacteria bacterium]